MDRWFTLVLGTCLLTGAASSGADEPTSAAAVGATLQLAETILEHHVLPPTRQEMLLAATRNAYQRVGVSPPLDLSRRFSDAASPDELRSIMQEQLDALLAEHPVRQDKLAEVLREGLFAATPGNVRLVNAENERVAEQFRSNRYVGTGIQLSMVDRVPTMVRVFPGGPADSVGAVDGDHIRDIDGQSTDGMSIERVVELLRGQEGSDVTVVLQQPASEERRTLTITRGVVPLQTVVNYQLYSGEQDEVVAYLMIERVSASCVNELEKYGEQLHHDGAAGLILDLRFTEPGNVHHAVLLANALLDGEEIGRVRTLSGDRTFVAEPGQLFPDVKIGLLVARGTSGTLEWVAAALQDAGRAMIFGDWTSGRALASEPIPFGSDDQVLILPTALLERPSGRPLFRLFGEPFAGGFDVETADRAKRNPWGVFPDVPLPAQTGAQLAEMPAAAARQLFNPPPRPQRRNSLRRSRSRNIESERSRSDD